MGSEKGRERVVDRRNLPRPSSWRSAQLKRRFRKQNDQSWQADRGTLSGHGVLGTHLIMFPSHTTGLGCCSTDQGRGETSCVRCRSRRTRRAESGLPRMRRPANGTRVSGNHSYCRLCVVVCMAEVASDTWPMNVLSLAAQGSRLASGS